MITRILQVEEEKQDDGTLTYTGRISSYNAVGDCTGSVSLGGDLASAFLYGAQESPAEQASDEMMANAGESEGREGEQ